MEGAISAFERLFPPDTTYLPKPPTAAHFAAIFQGLVRQWNGNTMEEWIKHMRERRVKPNATACGLMMEHYAQEDRPDDIVKLFEEMDREKIRADSVVYNVAMAYFARRKDAMTVESLFKRMLNEGVEPNSLLINTLMNAHVEAGSFAGVLKALKYTRARFPRVPLSIDTHNIVLKAYLYLGAPLDHILDEFDRLREMAIEADGYTYGTVIEAAYDVGRTETAYALYRRCIDLHRQKPSKGYLSTPIFTTVISGLTERGQFSHATDVFKDMIEYGFKPNSMTYGAVVKAFASQESSGASSLDAERFIEELLGQEDEELWKLPTNGQSTWYEQLYAPLFDKYRWQSARDMESLYQSIVDKGEKPTLFMMTYLMDAYRRERNINGVLDVWPHIVQYGVRFLDAGAALRDAATAAASRNTQPPILAMALSIYMRACTSAGQHTKVAEAWKDFQKHNLRVDPWNWLDLVNSLIRAGEIPRAFELLERVILPNRVAIQNYNPQFEEDPDTPLLFDEKFVDQDLSTDLHRRPLWERPGRETVMHQKFRLYQNGDVVSSLETFFRQAPLRRVWRIPRVIPQRLLLATNWLDKGYIIRPTGAYEPGPAVNPIRDPERAQAILVSTSTNFPKAFQMLTKFKAILQKRLGAQYKVLYEQPKVAQ
jgi:pentatricopeptide repeat-containing protein PET309